MIKTLLILLFFYLSSHQVFERIEAIGFSAGLVIFTLIWLLVITSVLILAFSPVSLFKILFAIAIFFLSFLGKTYALVTATNMGLTDFELLSNLFGFLENVFIEYQFEFLKSMLISSIALISILIPSHQTINLKPGTTLAIHIIPLLITSLILYQRGGQGSTALPDYSNIIAFSIVIGIDSSLNSASASRKQVTISSNHKKIKNIIVIIDESVRGDYLDINDTKGIKTNFPPDATVNFGIATAAANCSASSNITMRYGATRNNHMNDIKTNPSIWNYAQNAGYNTTYIDGQRTDGDLMNKMNEEELKGINNFIQLDKKSKPANKDILIAEKTRLQLQSPGNHFIYINKMGAHFPYEGKYPFDKTIYQPTMKRTYFGNKIDPSESEAAKPALEVSSIRKRSINSYKNALNWNINYFFKALTEGLDLDNTLIIYTSDHGQDFHEDGRPGWRTHCRVQNASWNEGIIPFIAITTNSGLLKRFRSAAKLNKNKISLFNLYPSVLEMFGYSPVDIKASSHIEKSIFEALPADNQQFFSYFFTRFGRKPILNKNETTPETSLIE